MQQKVVFKSKGLNCSGPFYRPDNYSATDGKVIQLEPRTTCLAWIRDLSINP